MLTNTKDIHSNGIKCLIYGPSGAGKTKLFSTLPDKASSIICSAESGMLCLAGDDIRVWDMSQALNKIESLIKFHDLVKKDASIKTIGLDSFTEIGQNASEALEKKYPDAKMGMVKWGDYNKQMTGIIKAFRDLPGKDVFVTCLSNIEKDENNRRYNAFTLQGSISERLPQYFDEVFFLHADRDDKGQTKRYFQTQPSDQVLAKDRSGKLELFEPNNLAHIIKKIRS